MKQIKVSEATGVVLDWLVARALGKRPSLFIFRQTGKLAKEHNYSTDWSQGGPIIEREKICPCPASTAVGSPWSATDLTGHITQFGPAPLIAAMRCYAASKLGEIVEIPEELA